MTPYRLSVSSWAALLLSGFAACTFGADDFEVVPSGNGSGATNNEGGEPSGSGGDGAGAEAAGGTSGNEGGSGSTVGGSGTSEAGAGGAEPVLTYTCSALSEPFTVLSAEELANRSIAERPLLLTNQDSVTVVAPTTTGTFVTANRVFYRSITDSQGGNVGPLQHYDVPGSRFSIAAGAMVGADVRVLATVDAGIAELVIPTTDQGNPFMTPTLDPITAPSDCTSDNGYVRDLAGSYDTDGSLGYAVTCAKPNDEFSLHVGASDQVFKGQVSQLASEAVDNIVRGYLKFGTTHVLIVGEEVAPRITVRLGSSLAELQTLHLLGLSDDPKVWSSIIWRRQADRAFLFGAAFTTDEPNPPPLVPASLFAGSVAGGDIGDLFTTAAQPNVPPAPMHLNATLTKASQLVAVDDVAPFGTYMIGAGATVSPRDRIHVTLVNSDGTKLAPLTEIYKTTSGTTITENTIAVARIGLGAIVVWFEGNALLARQITCLKE